MIAEIIMNSSVKNLDKTFDYNIPSTMIDKVKIGKLNYHKSDINWAEFGRKAEELCQKLGLDYNIKESLRAEMEAKK